jgi:hypothetical protein
VVEVANVGRLEVNPAKVDSTGFRLDPESKVSTPESTCQAFVITCLFPVLGVDSTLGGLPEKRPCRWRNCALRPPAYEVHGK